MDQLNSYLCGALTACSFFIAVFFFRYWRATRDRFFIFLAVTFVILAANWASLAGQRDEQNEAYFYIPRLVAFLILLLGIFDKNRRREPEEAAANDNEKKSS